MASVKKTLNLTEECQNCCSDIKRLYIVFDRHKEEAGHYCSIWCIKDNLEDCEFKKIVKVKTPKGMKKYVI